MFFTAKKTKTNITDKKKSQMLKFSKIGKQNL